MPQVGLRLISGDLCAPTLSQKSAKGWGTQIGDELAMIGARGGLLAHSNTAKPNGRFSNGSKVTKGLQELRKFTQRH